MSLRAQLVFGGTTLQLPALTDYDREILFQYVGDAAQRHGSVHLRAGRHSCTLRPARRAAAVQCDRCRRAIRLVVCELAGAPLCLHCVWRLVVADHRAAVARRTSRPAVPRP